MEMLNAIGTVLGIALLFIFRDLRDGKSLFKRNGAYEASQSIKQILDSQKELKEHFNEDTTVILNKLVEGQEKMGRSIDKHLVAEEGFQENMRDFMSEIRNKI